MDNKQQSPNINNFDVLRLILWLGSSYNSKKERIFLGTTALQKLVFIAQSFDEFKKLEDEEIYKDSHYFRFKADNFGPFSPDLAILLHKLEKHYEEISRIKNQYRTEYVLKEKLIECFTKSSKFTNLFETNLIFKEWCFKIHQKSKLNLDTLLREIYTNPANKDYLIKSKIADRYI